MHFIPFLKIIFDFFLIGGQLLYNVLVSVTQQRESAVDKHTSPSS